MLANFISSFEKKSVIKLNCVTIYQIVIKAKYIKKIQLKKGLGFRNK